MAASEDACASDTKNHSSRIATLNDAFRQGRGGGRFAITSGVAALGRDAVENLLVQLRDFDAFTPQNDPYGEHDFGVLEWAGQRLFWKIDYYDPAMRFGSSDPGDPLATTRMLTVMLAEEY